MLEERKLATILFSDIAGSRWAVSR